MIEYGEPITKYYWPARLKVFALKDGQEIPIGNGYRIKRVGKQYFVVNDRRQWITSQRQAIHKVCWAMRNGWCGVD